MTQLSRAAALALLLSASGCSLMTGTGDQEPLRDAEGFCQTLATLGIDHAVACIQTVSGREERWFGHFDAACARLGAAQASGRISYDAGAAEQCVQEMRTKGCGTASVPAPSCPLAQALGGTLEAGMLCSNAACTRAIAGTVAEGRACGTQADCGGDGRCDYPTDSCPGTCVRPGRVGAACSTAAVLANEGRQCEPGAWCSGGTCAAGAAEGGDCGATGNTCQVGLVCTNTGGIPLWACRAAGLGQPCQGGQCAPGLYCDTRTTTCAKIPLAAEPLGGNCGDSRFCSDGAWCNTGTSKCEARISDGACTGDLLSSNCRRGMRCDSGTCRPLLDPGDPCDPVAPQPGCRIGSRCVASGASGVCRLWPSTAGAACSSGMDGIWSCVGDLRCVPDQYAVSYTCQPFITDPATKCGGDMDCAGFEWGSRCVLLPGATATTCLFACR